MRSLLPRRASRPRRAERRGLAWLLPGAGLVLTPKCPACVAAWVAAFCGLGISPAAASTLRGGFILLCAAPPVLYLLHLALRRRRPADCCRRHTAR